MSERLRMSELQRRALKIFLEGLDKPPEERVQFFDQVAGNDKALRREIGFLSAADEADGDFLEHPVLARRNDPEPGQKIGPYRLVARLGTGGMGVVYRAERLDEFCQTVALKLVRQGASNTEVVRRFEAERQILAGLHHPYIGRLLDGGRSEEGFPYFAMELVEGQRIDTYCDHHTLSIEARLELFLKVCEGVHAAHQHPVVHRDLKPDNILVTADGTPKLLDFGIAKLLEPNDEHYALTRTNARRPMTVAYASPEQVRGGSVTTASDVHALGVLLYELLSGRPPHSRHGSDFSLQQAIAESDPPPPSRLIPDLADSKELEGIARARQIDPAALRRRLHGDLDCIVLKAIRKVPEERYRSAAHLAEDVRRYLDGLPVLARQSTLLYNFAKLARRHRGRLLAASLAALVLATAAMSALLWQREALASQRAKVVEELLKDLIKALTPDRTGGRLLDPVEVLADAEDSLVDLVDDDPQLTLAIAGALGEAYRALDERDAARRLLENSELIARQVYPGDHPEVAKRRHNLANLVAEMGDLEQAETLLRETLAIRRRLNQKPIRQIKTMVSLATVLVRQGHRLDEAEALYTEALAIRRLLYGDNSTGVAHLLGNLGALHTVRDQANEAIPLLERALEIRLENYGPEHSLVASAYNNLGRALQLAAMASKALEGSFLDWVQLDRAERAIGQALSIRQNLFGSERFPGHHLEVAPSTATRHSLRNLADILLERSETKIPLLLLSQVFATPALAERPVEKAETESLLGAYFLATGQLDFAEPCLRTSVETLRAHLGPAALATRRAEQFLERLHMAERSPQMNAQH